MNKDVSVITGASRGIGRAIALKFADDGHDLALFGRDSEKLNLLKNELSDLSVEVLTFAGDVADKNFVVESIRQVKDKFGKIDHLINNAGVGVFKKFIDSDLEDLKLQVDANVYGVFNFTRAVIDDMILRKRGSIINISSMAGKNGFKFGTTYSATKHAVMGFTRSLMLEVREFDIRVAAVCPGSVVTDMIMNTPIHPKSEEKVLTAEDVAEIVSSIIKLHPRAVVSELEIRPNNP